MSMDSFLSEIQSNLGLNVNFDTMSEDFYAAVVENPKVLLDIYTLCVICRYPEAYALLEKTEIFQCLPRSVRVFLEAIADENSVPYTYEVDPFSSKTLFPKSHIAQAVANMFASLYSKTENRRDLVRTLGVALQKDEGDDYFGYGSYCEDYDQVCTVRDHLLEGDLGSARRSYRNSDTYVREGFPFLLRLILQHDRLPL